MDEEKDNIAGKVVIGIGCGIPLIIWAGSSFAIPLMALLGSSGFVISFVACTILCIAVLASNKLKTK